MANSIRKQGIVLLTACALLFGSAVSAQNSRTLNLKNADINALINEVADITGKNFIIDPRVKGKVTVVATHEMSKKEIYQVFLSILEVHGFSAVPSGDVIKIIPDARAKQSALPSDSDGKPLAGDEMITEVIRVENVDAAQLVPILRPLIPQEGHLAAYPTTNTLIISDRAANVQRMRRIIERIDEPGESDLDVVRLEHASAAEVVRILSGLEQEAAKTRGAQPPLRMAADERTNSVLLSGDRNARLRMKAIISHLDTPLEAGGNTRVIYLRYAKAKDLVPVLTGVSESLDVEKQKGATKSTKSPVSIQADEAANALVITAPPDLFRSLRRVVDQLDIRRAQVLVEAIIAEVSTDRTRELGVQWIVDGTPDGNGPVGIINFGSAGAGIANIAAAVAGGNIPSIPDGALLGAGDFDSDSVRFAALLRALANDANTNILSTPSLMTLDNQEAEIVVGQNVPFVTGEFSTTGSTTSAVNPFRTIERQDVGLTLRVTPQINEGNAVKLEIEQEVSSISPSSASASDIITNKRNIKTTVMVEDGRTVVLGGLIDDDLQQSSQKVPVLGDVPVLGKAFRYQKTTKVKRNLMVFLRPVIVRDAATQARISGSKYSYIRAQQLEMRNKGTPLMPDEVAPVLPENLIELPPPFESRDSDDAS